ncbi:MAG: hypothetical protein ACYTE1_05965 [Planctomycetota bacterium]
MDIKKVKRYSLIEVALLAVFMVGLLIAHLITVVLSDLISLPGSGLSVSVPAGPGWERTATWQYEESESSMTLLGQFRPSNRGTMGVRWRYVFSTPDGSEQELLEQRAQRSVRSTRCSMQECFCHRPLRKRFIWGSCVQSPIGRSSFW